MLSFYDTYQTRNAYKMQLHIESTNLVLNINDPPGCWTDPFRRYKPLHAGHLGGLDPWYLGCQLLPRHARDQNIRALQCLGQTLHTGLGIISDDDDSEGR